MRRHTVSRLRCGLAGACLGVLLGLDPGTASAQARPGMGPPPAPDAGPSDRWHLQPASQANLWFHTMAVIAADQPGPLGLYSADYARYIRDVKMQAGVYPTALDSLASDLRKDIGDAKGNLEVLHFIPLYFPNADAEQMLRALRAVARGRTSDAALSTPEVRFGAFVVAQAMEAGGDRRLLQRLVDVAEREWDVFYRQYWSDHLTELQGRIGEMQSMWDSFVAPQLGSFLERRRLSAGLVMPSRALGPEGRIIDIEQFQRGDQVVAVQEPLASNSPDATVYAFLKELCFLIIDDQALAGEALSDDALQDLRRTAAVRCGAMLLEFYAPTLSARYRRVFLDAVGAEESSTVAAFERVYYLDPAIVEKLRDQIRGQ